MDMLGLAIMWVVCEHWRASAIHGACEKGEAQFLKPKLFCSFYFWNYAPFQ